MVLEMVKVQKMPYGTKHCMVCMACAWHQDCSAYCAACTPYSIDVGMLRTVAGLQVVYYGAPILDDRGEHAA